ncbi:hypothetical protein [Micromonospora chersina]|uniref:hypothetical protein n=1 Tax=Micromonospora chersina TaxID=47854 RepID=UPI0037104BC8
MSVVVLQRLAIPIPGGQIPFVTVLIFGALFVAFMLRRVVILPRRLTAYLFILASAIATTLQPDASPTSVIQLALLWAPFVFAVGPHSPHAFMRGIVVASAVAGGLGLLQSLVSRSSGVFLDPIGVLPPGYVLDRFNTTYPVIFGGSWMKANGVFFLEPSFLSLACALSLVYVFTGAPRIGNSIGRAAIGVALVFGMISSVAISGLVVVPFLLAGKGLRKRLLAIAAAAVLTLGVAAQLGIWQEFQHRASGGLDSGSNSARLVRPYTELVPDGLADSPVLGQGPGTARRAVALANTDWRTETTTPTLAKALYEYGLVGVALLGAAVLSVARRYRLGLAAMLAIVVAFVLPTDGLTSSFLVPLLLLADMPERDG